jgi:twinkle protein
MGIEQLIRQETAGLRAGQHRIACPVCNKDRKKKGERTLSVKIDGDAIVFQCWHCTPEVKGIIPLTEKRMRDVKYQHRPDRQDTGRRPLAVAPIRAWEPATLSLMEWWKSRGLTEKSAKVLGIKQTEAYVPALQRKTTCAVFPYTNKRQEYAAKIRSYPDKGFICHGAPATFFNIDNVEPGDWLIITEGEIDVATFIEAGYPSAVSIPSGAVIAVSNTQIDEREGGKFRCVWEAREHLDRAARILIATDGDGPGTATAEELARRIGKDRVWRVTYPEGCKDANDVWLRHGQAGIDAMVADAEPWPIAGLHEAGDFFAAVDTMYDHGLGRGESTGYNSIDDIYTPSPGMLTVVTGHPSSGKSEMIDQIMVNLSRQKGWRHAICSFENDPSIHISKLISKYMRRPFFTGPTQRISPEELEIGKQFVQEHFSFIQNANGDLMDLDEIMDRLRAAVMRHGVRGAVIDPYNYIRRDRDARETDWVSEMLSRLRSFAKSNGIHIWFVAHPAKMMRSADGKVPPPGGYDISGSAAWFAKADHGITVHRPDPAGSLLTEVYSWKSRFAWLGRQGRAEVLFNPVTSSYLEVGDDPNPQPQQPTRSIFDFIGPPPEGWDA